MGLVEINGSKEAIEWMRERALKNVFLLGLGLGLSIIFSMHYFTSKGRYINGYMTGIM